jgi:hypothetical protein
MKKIILPLVSVLFIVSCNSNNISPDVSGIKVNLEVKRFDSDFFAIDTNHIAASLGQLLKKYPKFEPDYIRNILGLDMDSLLVPGNIQEKAVRMFIHDYMWVKDSSDLQYKDFSKETDAITHALQLVKYYFPSYKLPQSVIPFIGPINANFETSFGTQGDILTGEGLGIGLQLHLGKNFSLYTSAIGQSQYPEYLSNNFDADHIPVNCMRNIIDDLYPDNSDGKPLIEQMVEKGKRIYLLTRFLPQTPEYICFGYTKKQLKDSYTNEAVIWNFFLNNNLLQNSDVNITKNYIGESPKTEELGDAAPGNIGTFAGLQIVKKYMERYPGTTLQQLITTDPTTIFDKAKYKPKG